MTGRGRKLLAAVLAAAGLAVVATAIAGGGTNVRGSLGGFSEVPAVSTAGSGTFSARMAPGGEAIEWRLSYADLEGSVTQAHIHFGQRSANGGISVWLCSNLSSPPTPAGFSTACPQSGTVTGTIEPDDVVGPSGQGIAPGELEELVRAIGAGVAYANVHSTKFPGGEIRAQLRPGQSP